MKMARGGSNICVPCAATPRGQSQLQDADKRLNGYRASQTVKPRFQRAMERWFTKRPAPTWNAKVVCAWCGKVLKEGAEPASHGICQSCQERM